MFNLEIENRANFLIYNRLNLNIFFLNFSSHTSDYQRTFLSDDL